MTPGDLETVVAAAVEALAAARPSAGSTATRG